LIPKNDYAKMLELIKNYSARFWLSDIDEDYEKCFVLIQDSNLAIV